MKITEEQLRRLIRKKILIKEYQAGRTTKFTWNTCRNIDLPDHLFKTAEGRSAVKSAEKQAAFIAQVYGMPGFVCDIFSSLIGDNPNKKFNRDNKKKKREEGRSISTGIFAESFDNLSNKKAFFINEIASNSEKDETKKSQAVSADKTEFNSKLTKLNGLTVAGDDPIKIVKKAIEILGIGSEKGNAIDVVRKMKSENSVDNNTINSMITNQAKDLLIKTTSNNLEKIKDKYTGNTEFESFVNHVRSTL